MEIDGKNRKDDKEERLSLKAKTLLMGDDLRNLNNPRFAPQVHNALTVFL